MGKAGHQKKKKKNLKDCEVISIGLAIKTTLQYAHQQVDNLDVILFQIHIGSNHHDLAQAQQKPSLEPGIGVDCRNLLVSLIDFQMQLSKRNFENLDILPSLSGEGINFWKKAWQQVGFTASQEPGGHRKTTMSSKALLSLGFSLSRHLLLEISLQLISTKAIKGFSDSVLLIKTFSLSS